MNKIRVTYSGLIALVVGLISVVTGMFFTLIVTRKLNPEEFGLWSVIGGMLSYFLIAEPIISFWSTRQIARGEEVGKTSILSSLIFSFGAVVIYLIFAIFVYDSNHSYLNSILLAAILLPVMFVSQTLSGINLGYKPHTNSYGLVAFESLKIPSGVILVYFLGLGVNGAILTTLIAHVGRIGILIYFGKNRLQGKFEISQLKHWIQLSWIPFYSNLGHVAAVIDVIIYSIITKSVLGVAYYSVSNTIASMISHSGLISQALYPKILSQGSLDHVRNNFTRLMYFAIPLLGIAIVFAKPALYALNPVYSNAYLIVILLSFRTFFYVITSVLYQVLLGMETIDLEKNLKFSKYAKSRLFLMPTLTNIQYILYICILSSSLFFLNLQQATELTLATWWAIISLSTQIPFLIYAWILVKKHVNFSPDIGDMLKYIGGTIIFALVFLITSPYFIKYKTSIYDFIPGVILEVAICLGVYLSVTFLIDTKTRILFKSIFSEFVSK